MTTFDNEFDDPNRVQTRKDQEDPWVMYLIVRESLGMGVGKTAAQVGHAVGIMCHHFADLDFLHESKPWILLDTDKSHWEAYTDWARESFRKIVLKADDKEWEKLKKECECFIVRDAGLTEVAAGSETVIGLWPMKRSNAPKLVRKLQVLK